MLATAAAVECRVGVMVIVRGGWSWMCAASCSTKALAACVCLCGAGSVAGLLGVWLFELYAIQGFCKIWWAAAKCREGPEQVIVLDSSNHVLLSLRIKWLGT